MSFIKRQSWIELIFSGHDCKAHEPPELLIPLQEQRELGTSLSPWGKSTVDKH